MMSVYNIEGKKLTNDYSVFDIRLTSETLYETNITAKYIQCSFVTENGLVWMITADATCYIVDSGTLVKTITLSNSVGHANSCNYCNGKAYVSDWDNGTYIHVFEVDYNNKTMTWEKDITVPTTYGRTEFFVLPDEKQIYSLSWNVNAYSDSQYMVIGLWKLDKTDSYTLSNEFIVGGVNVCQGMTINNGFMYILSNNIESNVTKHGGVMVVNLATGEEYLDNSQTGTILTMETEGITNISKSEFLVTGMHGAQFLLTQEN